MPHIPNNLVEAIRGGCSLAEIKELISIFSINESYCFRTPVDAAIEADSAEIVEYILSHEAYREFKIEDPEDPRCVNILHLACDQDEPNIDIIRLILQHGIDPNIDDEGVTVLVTACRKGGKDIVQLLLNYGADINHKNDDEKPVYVALERNTTDVLELLLNNGAEIFTLTYNDKSLLNAAINSNKHEAAKLILASAANLNSSNKVQWNELSCAIYNNEYERIEMLLHNGHEIDRLCLYASVVCNDYTIFEMIVRNIEPSIITMDPYFMVHIFDNWKEDDRIDKLWILLRMERINLCMNTCGKAFAFCLFRERQRFFNEMNEYEWSELLHRLIDQGLRLSSSDAELIIRVASYAAVHEFVKLVIEITLPKITSAAFHYGLETHLDSFLIPYCLEACFDVYYAEWDLPFLQHYLGLFTVDEKQKCLIRSVLERLNREELKPVDDIINKMDVKSLTELARDAVRKNLNEVCIDSRCLISILDQLQLPKAIVDIIQCKVPINRL